MTERPLTPREATRGTCIFCDQRLKHARIEDLERLEGEFDGMVVHKTCAERGGLHGQRGPSQRGSERQARATPVSADRVRRIAAALRGWHDRVHETEEASLGDLINVLALRHDLTEDEVREAIRGWRSDRGEASA